MRYIESHVHQSQVGVLLELEVGADLAADSDEFRQLAHDLALQIAGCKPKSPGELLEQPFIKDPGQLVSHRLYVVSTLLKTPIRITRFVRYDANA
jgi:elongation factor Ts